MATTMSGRTGVANSFLAKVVAAAPVVANEILPIFAGTQIKQSSKDKLRRPTFNPNRAQPRQQETQRRPVSPTRASIPAKKEGFDTNTLLLIGGGLVLLLVLIPVLRR